MSFVSIIFFYCDNKFLRKRVCAVFQDQCTIYVQLLTAMLSYAYQLFDFIAPAVFLDDGIDMLMLVDLMVHMA